MKLGREFFERDARVVAEELLGKKMVVGNKSLIITETEAYLGVEDLASHARFGQTKRSSMMWSKGGTLYVYLIYGMYEMANVVTGEEGSPSAVLLRSGITGEGVKVNGPGKFTKYLGINRKMNGVDLISSENIYFEEIDYRIVKILKTPRIGIAYAGEWASKEWRYVIEDEAS